MAPPSIKIILADEKDVPLIRDLAYRSWPSAYGAILTPAQIEYMLAKMYDETVLREQIARGHRFLLALVADEPAAFAGYELDGDAVGVTRLHKLYALPETRGHGVGYALVESVVADLDAAGQRRVRLNVNRYNPSVRFYERQGFVKIGEEDLDFGGGYYMNDFIMERSIKPR